MFYIIDKININNWD